MSASRGVPCLVFRRYFLSQMSWEAGCSGISATDLSVSLTTSRRTVLMLLDSPFRTDQLPVERTAGGTETAGATRNARRLPESGAGDDAACKATSVRSFLSHPLAA